MVFLRQYLLLVAAVLTVSEAWLLPSVNSNKNKMIKIGHPQQPLHQSSRALDIPTQQGTTITTSTTSTATATATATASRSIANKDLLQRAMDQSPKQLSLRDDDTDIGGSTGTAREDQQQIQHLFTLLQQCSRVAPVLTVAAYAYNPKPFDVATQTLWSWMYDWDITHTSMFEAHVASFSFVFFIACFSCTHLILGLEKKEAKQADQQPIEYRLDGIVPQVDPLSWTKLTMEGIKEWFNPLVSYLVSIWIYQQVFHTYHEPIPLAPTFGVLIIEVMVGVFLYDLCFAPIHVLLHKGPFKNVRQLHGYHHRHTNGALNPVETVQHSYLDGGLQVMVNILVQHISPFGGPKHMLSRILHNIIVTYLLTESHSGYNFSWMSHNIWPEFLGGSPRHDRHHKDGRVYYQQFFTYLDDFMGWTDRDVQKELHAKQQQQQRRQLRQEEARDEEEEEDMVVLEKEIQREGSDKSLENVFSSRGA